MHSGKTATKSDLAQAIADVADAYSTGGDSPAFRLALRIAVHQAASVPARTTPAKRDLRINAERWLNGEPSAKERKARGDYRSFVVTFADGSEIRTGTYDEKGAGDEFMLRHARYRRMQIEFAHLEAKLPRARLRANAGDEGELRELQQALAWHWCREPNGWHCTRVINIPEIAGVRPTAETVAANAA